MFNLALLLQHGAKGEDRDASEFVEPYSRAIDKNNDVWAMIKLAVLLENGTGVKRDCRKAFELYNDISLE